jgi:SAM-dependent methyltransferase
MDIEWTSKNGIAEVKTPLFRFSANTDPLSPKAVVHFPGTFVPDEAATGLAFPFIQIQKRKFSESKSFTNSLVDSDLWIHNGFSSRAGMEQAHDVLLEALEGTELDPGSDVLDLGCGNGLLVEKVVTRYVGVTPHGVELNTERAKAAYDRLPGGFVFLGDIRDLGLWDQEYDLIIFMPGRLKEMSEDDRLKVMQQLIKAPRILLYTYQDHHVEFPTVFGTYYTVRKHVEKGEVRAALLVNTGVSHSSAKH